MKRRALLLACGIPAAVILFLLLTLLFTPNDAIRGVLVRAAGNAGYTVDLVKFRKGFPFAFKADALVLSSEKGELVKLRDPKVRLELLPLLTGKTRLAINGKIGTGTVEAEVDLGKSPGWDIACRRVRLEDIPYFATVAEARVAGEMRLDGKMETRKGVSQGVVQLDVKGAELAGIKISQMPLPDASYREVRGALTIDKGRAVLKSFTLNGDGIYVRLSGDTMLTKPIGSSALNLNLEMMPKPAFLERQKLVFLLLMKYQSSPGAYSIPIRGTLAHPAM